MAPRLTKKFTLPSSLSNSLPLPNESNTAERYLAQDPIINYTWLQPTAVLA